MVWAEVNADARSPHDVENPRAGRPGMAAAGALLL